jgi:hypothetical protein
MKADSKRTLLAAALAAALCLTPVFAQEQQELPADQEEPAAPQTVRPGQDAESVSGIGDVAVPGELRNYLQLHFRFRQTIDSNVVNQHGLSNVEGISYPSAGLALHRGGRNSDFVLRYNVGGAIYSERSHLNRSFHNVGVSQSYRGRRAAILLANEFSYLPESAFGFTGFGGLSAGSAGGSTLSGIGTRLLPSQTVLTDPVSRISNTSAGEFQYLLGPRDMITASGSFGLLRFRGPAAAAFLNLEQVGFSGGYERLVTRRDTLGVFYAGNMVMYSLDRRIESHSANLGWGRRITGRLRVQLAGGPQFTRVSNFGIPGGDEFMVRPTARAGIAYQMPLTQLSAGYAYSVSAGSGVLTGASTHRMHFNVQRSLARFWEASFSTGYARNEGLRRTFDAGRNVNTFFVSGGLSRRLTEHTAVFLNYTLQHQDSNIVSTNLVRHIVGFGFSWTPRPLRID